MTESRARLRVNGNISACRRTRAAANIDQNRNALPGRGLRDPRQSGDRGMLSIGGRGAN
jgi:hypothetical protein